MLGRERRVEHRSLAENSRYRPYFAVIVTAQDRFFHGPATFPGRPACVFA
jgi:hypothetical protein